MQLRWHRPGVIQMVAKVDELAALMAGARLAAKALQGQPGEQSGSLVRILGELDRASVALKTPGSGHLAEGPDPIDSSTYSEASRTLQRQFDTVRIADRIEEKFVRQIISPHDQQSIEQADMFFLATADEQGRPTCSYKGGDPGFVRVVDERTVAFPHYDGNGMYLSAGNVLANPNVGLLFIDFERGQRFRIQGSAGVDSQDPLMEHYPQAQFVVRVQVRQVFPNCPRYIHRYRLLERSKYVPRGSGAVPVPDWKRDEWARDLLPAGDPARNQEDSRMQSNVQTLHERACRQVSAQVDRIAEDQWNLPTPCTEWDVRALVGHLVSGTRWVAPLVAGMTIEQVGDSLSADPLGDDPAGAWLNAADEAMAACSAAGAMGRAVHLSAGDSPAEDYIAERVADLVLHAWDLARATGTDDRLDPELVESALGTYARSGHIWRQYGVLGPKVEVAEGSDPQTELLAESGRDPQWRPSAGA